MFKVPRILKGNCFLVISYHVYRVSGLVDSNYGREGREVQYVGNLEARRVVWLFAVCLIG